MSGTLEISVGQRPVPTLPPGTGPNPQNLQDTRGTMARNIRYPFKNHEF